MHMGQQATRGSTGAYLARCRSHCAAPGQPLVVPVLATMLRAASLPERTDSLGGLSFWRGMTENARIAARQLQRTPLKLVCTPPLQRKVESSK